MRLFTWMAGFGLLTALLGCERADVSPAAVPDPGPVVNVDEVKPKAEQGNVEAQRQLGQAYASGRGVRQDYKEAAVWYQKAADQGDAAAENSLGELCEAGQGQPQSNTEAAKWYRKAAEQNYAPAQYNLAVLYAFGRGVRSDEAEAAKWFRQAAERGHALAQYNIGQRYQLGIGVAVDLPEAFKWLSLAAASIPDAVPQRDQLKSSLNRAQLAEGRKRLTAFATKPK
jgi:hypothetical protein